MDISDIDSLRNYAIATLKKLSNREITIEEAGVTGKLCENVVSTIKVQLEYAKMLDQEPNIQFLENCTLPKGRLIESAKKQLKLENKGKSRLIIHP